MKLNSEVARDIAYMTPPEGYIHVAEEHVEESRWGLFKRTVFIDRKSDKYYAFTWEQGATEMQDYDDFEYKDEIDVDEVKPFQVTVTEYHKV